MRGPAASIAAAAVVIAAAYSALLRRRPAPSRLALGSWGVVGSIATIEHTPTARRVHAADGYRLGSWCRGCTGHCCYVHC